MWRVLNLNTSEYTSPNLVDLSAYASLVRNVAGVVPTKILPWFPSLLENQGFRGTINSFSPQRSVDPNSAKFPLLKMQNMAE